MYFTKKKDHSINIIQTWYVDINIKQRQQIHVHVLLDKLHYPTIVFIFPRLIIQMYIFIDSFIIS